MKFSTLDLAYLWPVAIALLSGADLRYVVGLSLTAFLLVTPGRQKRENAGDLTLIMDALWILIGAGTLLYALGVAMMGVKS